jgi:rhomboid family GlyGly-CTERM serine protease
MDLAALIYHRQAFLDGQWWLLLTAQLVHFNLAHALANLTGSVLLCSLFRPWLRWQEQALAMAGGMFGVAWVLVWDADCAYYAGASGALHGWAAGGALLMVMRHFRTSRVAVWIAFALLAGLAVKLLLALGLKTNPAVWGFAVYYPAHLAGALGGLLAALAHPGASPRSDKHRQEG